MILERDLLLAQSTNDDDTEEDQRGYESSGDEVEFSDEIADSLLHKRRTSTKPPPSTELEKTRDAEDSDVTKISHRYGIFSRCQKRFQKDS